MGRLPPRSARCRSVARCRAAVKSSRASPHPKSQQSTGRYAELIVVPGWTSGGGQTHHNPSRSNSSSLRIVAGALRLNVGGEGVVFQHAINGAAPLDLGANGGDGVHRLPGNLPIPDGAIAACIHSLRYAGVPTVCALTHGYRVAKLGSAAETDAAVDADGEAKAEVSTKKKKKKKKDKGGEASGGAAAAASGWRAMRPPRKKAGSK